MAQYHVAATLTRGRGDQPEHIKSCHHLIEAESIDEAVEVVRRRHGYTNGQDEGWSVKGHLWKGKRLPRETIMEKHAWSD
jgi:hypothetical protein